MALTEKDRVVIRERVEQCHLDPEDVEELRRLLYSQPLPRPYVEAPPGVGEQ